MNVISVFVDRGYMPLSKTDKWETPQDYFDSWNSIHKFDLDVAALKENHKTDKWLGLDHEDPTRRDGLTAEWDGQSIWCNPPYGRGIGNWVKRADDESKTKKVVMLLPSRTDTAWFHDYVLKHDVEFLRGRLKFGNAVNSAPFASILVVMNGK
jgi:phage N-6-adenine-methyltransferase